MLYTINQLLQSALLFNLIYLPFVDIQHNITFQYRN